MQKWFRFSLRKLLVLVAVSALILAVCSRLSSEYQQSRMSAKIIEAAGGNVSWQTESFFLNVTVPSIGIVDLQNCKLTDEVYAALAKIPDEYFVLMIDSNIFNQQAIVRLAKIENLSGLFLESGPVAEELVLDLQERRPDIMVTAGVNSESGYREYPRPND